MINAKFPNLKNLIPIVFILIPFLSRAQKINSYRYKKVDSVLKYKNAELIIYRNKLGKQITDTVYYSKMKMDIRISDADVVIVDDDKVLKLIRD
jgi:hypothetical protein